MESSLSNMWLSLWHVVYKYIQTVKSIHVITRDAKNLCCNVERLMFIPYTFLYSAYKSTYVLTVESWKQIIQITKKGSWSRKLKNEQTTCQRTQCIGNKLCYFSRNSPQEYSHYVQVQMGTDNWVELSSSSSHSPLSNSKESFFSQIQHKSEGTCKSVPCGKRVLSLSALLMPSKGTRLRSYPDIKFWSLNGIHSYHKLIEKNTASVPVSQYTFLKGSTVSRLSDHLKVFQSKN